MAAFENQKVVAKAAIQSVNKEAYEAMKQMMGKLGLEVNETKTLCCSVPEETDGRMAFNSYAFANKTWASGSANGTRMILLTLVLVGLGSVGAFLLLCQWWVYTAGDSRVFKRLGDVPENEVGLVLGTAKWVRRGKLNRFFSYRIDAAVRLYKCGKVRRLLLSGNGIDSGRSEPEQMRKELIDRGIPADALILDNDGVRTLDSIVRAKQVYGLNQVTIISQEFHNRRALFLCRAFGIDAVGFNAEDVPASQALRTVLRELLARVDAVLEARLFRQSLAKRNVRLR